jgi:hypothetical protein
MRGASIIFGIESTAGESASGILPEDRISAGKMPAARWQKRTGETPVPLMYERCSANSIGRRNVINATGPHPWRRGPEV